ncbi:hypothetical protein NMD24_01465 [Escherichia coli]
MIYRELNRVLAIL